MKWRASRCPAERQIILSLLEGTARTEGVQQPNVSDSDREIPSNGVYPDLGAGNGLIDNEENSGQQRNLRLTGLF